MTFTFPHSAFAGPVNLDGLALQGIFRMTETLNCPSLPGLEEALDKPVGLPPLTQLLTEENPKKILLLIDDNTRNTPVSSLLPAIIKKIRTVVPLAKIEILIGNGLHRPMTPKEIETHVGKSVAIKIPVFNHDACDSSALLNLGTAPDGTPILVNRRLREADFVLSLGQVAPHRVAGFSGGSKMVQPGVSGEAITASVHWRGWNLDSEAVFGVRDNPIRLEMDSIAKKAGLRYIVNCLLSQDGKVAGVFGGDPIEAHRAGCAAALRMYSTPVRRADIVIIDSYPCDIDLWQAAKAATPAEMALKPGGSVILVTPCPEKISCSHPELMELGYRPMSRIRADVECGRLTDLITASHLSAFGRILEKGRLVIVSPGFSPEEISRMGFIHAENLQAAVNTEKARLGQQATVSIIPDGGKIFPIIQD